MNPSWLLAAVLALPALAAPSADPVRAAVASVSRGNVPEGGGIPALVRSLTGPQRGEARVRLGALDKKRLSPEQVDELAYAYRLLDDEDALAPNGGRRATPGAILANTAASALNAGRYEEAMSLAALALKTEPGNREALTVLNFSRGRTSSADSTSAPPDVAAPRARIRKGLRLQHPVKLRSAAPPPDLTGAAGAPARPGPLPLLPIAVLGLGAAFSVYRSRAAYESRDGLDDEHPTRYGSGQRFVTGAIMAACAGAGLYLAGSALVSAAPLALRYASPVAAHGARLAQSEAGAMNPGEQGAANEVPQMLARVIPLKDSARLSGLIGLPGRQFAFVTAADDIANTPAAQLSERLGIENTPRYAIIRFPTQALNIGSRIVYDENPLFIGRGLTSGGAREFQIPNIPIPDNATLEIVGVGR